MAKGTPRRMKPMQGGREHIGAAVELRIRRAIESTARSHNCSMSFVQNTILAEALGIDVDEVYYGEKRRKRA